MTNLAFLVDSVTARLQALSLGQNGPGLRVPAWRRPEAVPAQGRIGDSESTDLSDFADDGTVTSQLRTLADLIEFVEHKLLFDNEGEGDRAWTAGQSKGTREALVRRLRGSARHLGRLVRGDLPARKLEAARPAVLDSGSQINVIDIHSLPQAAQMFVVGVLLRQVFERREAGSSGGKVFVVLDELNKYAPAEGDSPIKEVLLDIAERGRSLGVILIGAQQTASEVERRIVSNSAVRVSGRLDTAEAERSEYRWLSQAMRQRSTILTPGTMVLNQPDVPTPVLVTFPFPAWATRREEAVTLPDPDELGELLD